MGTVLGARCWIGAMGGSVSGSIPGSMPVFMSWALYGLDLLAQPLIAAGLGALAALAAFVAALRGLKVIAPGDTLLIRLQPDPEERPS